MLRRPTVISGSARNSACFASMAFGASHGSRQQVSISPASYIRSLLAARDGRLWIGTDEGLASWKDGKLTHYPELAGQSVVTLLEDREGTIWAGGWAAPTGRLCAIQSGSVQCYGEDGSLGHGVLSLYEDSGGNLWAGAATGLWRWKPGPPKLYPMPAPEIAALIEGDNGALWIAMRGGIRQLVDGKAEAYPLPGVGRQFKATRLLRDRDGGLWIGTATGVSCMCTREGRICLRSLTVSQEITSTVSLRIVKAIFGSPPSMASTAFATSPSPRFPSSKVCLMPALGPSWRPGMAAFGLARLMA